MGNQQIKQDRARRVVPVSPGGVVADYVPFYYASRSPMMFAIHKGNVPSYQEGCDRLIYLITSVEALVSAGLPTLGTDRNARMEISHFSSSPAEIVGMVDWPLMKSRYWGSTVEDPDRAERRQTECLVRDRVPWRLVTDVAAKSEGVAAEVRAVLAAAQDATTRVHVGCESWTCR